MTTKTYPAPMFRPERNVVSQKDDGIDAHAGLMAYLEKNFAFTPPNLDMPDRQIWVNVGKEQVVEHFRVVHKRQYNP